MKQIVETLKQIVETLKQILETLKQIVETLKQIVETSLLFSLLRKSRIYSYQTDFSTQGAILARFSSVRNKHYSHSLRTLPFKSLHKMCQSKKDIFVNLVDTFYAKIWHLTCIKNVNNACCSH